MQRKELSLTPSTSFFPTLRIHLALLRTDYEAQNIAAARIQCGARKKIAHGELQKRRTVRQQNLAATRIQSKKRSNDACVTVEDLKMERHLHKEALRIYVEVDIDESDDVSYMELAAALHISDAFRHVAAMAYSDRNGLLESMAVEDTDGSGNFTWEEFQGYIEKMIQDIRSRRQEGLAVSSCAHSFLSLSISVSLSLSLSLHLPLPLHLHLHLHLYLYLVRALPTACCPPLLTLLL